MSPFSDGQPLTARLSREETRPRSPDNTRPSWTFGKHTTHALNDGPEAVYMEGVGQWQIVGKGGAKAK